MGEFTAVASAKRAVRGDFSDGALVVEPVVVESSDEALGLVATVTCGFFWLSDISSEMRLADS